MHLSSYRIEKETSQAIIQSISTQIFRLAHMLIVVCYILVAGLTLALISPAFGQSGVASSPYVPLNQLLLVTAEGRYDDGSSLLWSSSENLVEYDSGYDFLSGEMRTCQPFSTATVALDKTFAVWDPNEADLAAESGSDLLYTVTLANAGNCDINSGSLILIEQISQNLEFYNGDIDDGGPEVDAVSFTQTSASGLSFTYSLDVAFSNRTAFPTSFSDCTYKPVNGYDPQVNYICINPKGTLLMGHPNPEFKISFRARIK